MPICPDADARSSALRRAPACTPRSRPRAKSSGSAVVYLICSMANADDTLEISMRAISFL